MHIHKGSGITVDNIFNPVKSVMPSVFKKIAKPVAKKALTTGVSHMGDKVGKKASEKAGDLIMKKLLSMRKNAKQMVPKPKPIKPVVNKNKKRVLT